MKCLTVTLNASVDAAYVMDQLSLGNINRIHQKFAVAGGKGNNVARVLATFGHSVTTTGFVAGSSGQFIQQSLQARGIETAFVTISGESRTSLAIVEERTGTVTEIREPGQQVTEKDCRHFLMLLRSLSTDADAVVFSGSLPPGAPEDFYSQAIDSIDNTHALVVLDSSGLPFRKGLGKRVNIVKPNSDEMTALMEIESTDEEMAQYAYELLGPTLADSAMVLLSLGKRGAALISRNGTIWADAPEVKVRSPVGAGDAMVAGFIDAYLGRIDLEDCLKQSVATGTAAALQLMPGSVDLTDVDGLKERVRIRR